MILLMKLRIISCILIQNENSLIHCFVMVQNVISAAFSLLSL